MKCTITKQSLFTNGTRKQRTKEKTNTSCLLIVALSIFIHPIHLLSLFLLLITLLWLHLPLPFPITHVCHPLYFPYDPFHLATELCQLSGIAINHCNSLRPAWLGLAESMAQPPTPLPSPPWPHLCWPCLQQPSCSAFISPLLSGLVLLDNLTRRSRGAGD